MAEETACSSDGRKLRVVVVGGSIAGLSAAHALLRAGCRVVVLEKARSVAALGAGLALDLDSCSILQQWNCKHTFLRHSIPLPIEEIRAVLNGQKKIAHSLVKNENHDHRAVHWSDLHRILFDALPTQVMLWGHEFLSFEESNGSCIKAKALVAETRNIVEFEGDLLVGADGLMSQTRRQVLPHEQRRYSGYCGWRGVFDSSCKGYLEATTALRKQYPNLGSTLYMELAQKTHCVLFELPGGRLNWVWYWNQPEPHLKGSSATTRPDTRAIKGMHEEAERVWLGELSAVIRATEAPFLNAIFDRDPLEKLVWGRLVLVGDAAHPTAPHAGRGANMSIGDASCLGDCIAKWGSQQLDAALHEYESIRLPLTTQQVLFSRYVGTLKQGFTLSLQHWLQATEEERKELLHANWKKFPNQRKARL